MKILKSSLVILSTFLVCSCSTARPGMTWQEEDPLSLLIVGGGGAPSHNQVSLEKNVQYIGRLLDGMHINHDTTLLYTGGNDGHRIVQLRDPEHAEAIPEITKVLSYILGPQRELYNQYRAHELGAVDGYASPDEIRKALDNMVDNQADRILLYYTGHGGPGLKTSTHNTSMALWDHKSYRVDDLCKDLGSITNDTPVMLLMVQCYSGGFANFIFNEGNPEKGLADQPRFGFFSTVHDRTAAGCTPDINESEYHEYSTYFFEGLWGTSRNGEKIELPDYDFNEEVTFDEAHAYALIHSTTIDVSIKTSDVFLRHYSRLKKDVAEQNMLNTESYSVITNHADAIDLAVLEGLSEKYSLEGDDRIAAARKRCEELEKEEKELDKKKLTLNGDITKRKRTIAMRLIQQWPELSNPWHPDLGDILKKEGDEILKLVNDHKDFKPMMKSQKEYKDTDEKKLDLDREWAGHMRFIRCAENVALQHNLQFCADPAIQDRFDQLKELEHQGL